MSTVQKLDLERLAGTVAPFSRRRMLAGSAVLSGSAAAMGLSGCGSTPAPGGLDAIGEDWDVLGKFTTTILPVDQDARFINLKKTTIFENMNQLLADVPADLRGDLSTGLSLFNYAAIVLGFHFKPFTGLDNTDAVAYVRRWESGNTIQRGLMWALKQIVYVSYWADPVTWEPIEYDGPVTRKHGIPSLGNAPLPQAEAEQ